MKTCGFEKLINPYLDGELSGAKLRAFEEHLPYCPRCREEVEQVRELLSSLQGLEEMEVPPMLQDRLHAALSHEILKGDGRAVKRKFNPWALTAVASAVVVCLAGGIALFARGNPAPQSNMLGMVGKGTSQSNAMEAPPTQSRSVGIAAPLPAATMAATMAPAMSENDGGYKGSDVITKDEESLNATDKGSNTVQTGEDKRKLIYTAYVVAETHSYDKSRSDLNALLAKHSGYVQASQESGVPEAYRETQGRTMVVSIRIPIDQYGTVMTELQGLGNLLQKSENTEDVSRQYVDTKARTDTLVKQRERYMALLDKADTTESIVALQTEITNLTVRIEQDTAQLRYWDDMVAYSTITVELREIVVVKNLETAKPNDINLGDRTSGAFYQTLNDMKRGLENFAVWFVGFLPWLAILVAIGGIATAIAVPTVRKRRREALKKAAEKAAEETKKEE